MIREVTNSGLNCLLWDVFKVHIVYDQSIDAMKGQVEEILNYFIFENEKII